MHEDQREVALKRVHTINMPEMMSFRAISAGDDLRIGQHPVMKDTLSVGKFSRGDWLGNLITFLCYFFFALLFSIEI